MAMATVHTDMEWVMDIIVEDFWTNMIVWEGAQIKPFVTMEYVGADPGTMLDMDNAGIGWMNLTGTKINGI